MFGERLGCAQGMGEGEGRKDVSDQIEDEDQLLGAQQKDQPPPDSKVQGDTKHWCFCPEMFLVCTVTDRRCDPPGARALQDVNWKPSWP